MKSEWAEVEAVEDVEFLRRRVRELERARDSQAREISKLRARGAVLLTVGEHTVYGTSAAVNAVRRRLEGDDGQD